jgi:TP901 family phage tail tape measure protein
MATRTSQLIVELLDRVSAPARRASDALRGLGRTARDEGGQPAGFMGRLNAAMDANNVALDRARAGVIDSIGIYYTLRSALGAPIQAAANFETALEDIGQKAGIPVDQLGALGDRIKQVAKDTNTSAMQIAAGVDALVGRGVDIDTALIAAEPIGKAATAYRASAEDLAAASQSAVDNLKVPAAQIETALDMMAQAGKEGAFELRDMAQYFPALGAAYQGLGQEGTGAVADLAAALQVVRKGTGDSASAATNLQNVLQKIYAPATVKKFGDRGVDIFVEMEKAAKRGLTPIEAIAEITNKTLDGDLSKLGFLFEDAQVQAGMRALIQNMDEFRAIREKTLKAQGVVMEDYERRIRTAAGAQARWAASIEHLNVILGTTLLPLLNDLLDTLIPIISHVGDLAAQYPELTRAVVVATAGLFAFRAALATLRFVGLLGKGGALSLLSLGMSTVGAAAIRMGGAAKGAVALQAALGAMSGGQALTTMQKLGVGLGAALRAAPGVGILSAVMSGLGSAIAFVGSVLAGISAPVWGLIAAGVALVAAAGYQLWYYWDRITSVLSGVARRLGEELQPAIDAIRPALDWLVPIGEMIASGWEAAKAKLSAFWDWLGGLFQREILAEDQKAAWEQSGYDYVDRLIGGIKSAVGRLVEIGREMIQSLWDGAVEKFNELLAWFRELPARIVEAIGNIDLSNIIQWPSMPEWLGGGAPTANETGESSSSYSEFGGVDGAFAKGGKAKAGGTYLVGEEGPELITPRQDGFVHTAAETRRMMTGAAGRSMPSAAARKVTLNLGGITIHASPGMDARDLAEQAVAMIEQKIGAALRGVQADTGMEAF